MKKYVDIPKGCKRIRIDVDEERVTVSYLGSENVDAFYCEETDDEEERPKTGDFAVFWSKGERWAAVCANYVGKPGDESYIASDGGCYDEAVRFRSYEQYLRVRGVCDVEE